MCDCRRACSHGQRYSPVKNIQQMTLMRSILCINSNGVLDKDKSRNGRTWLGFDKKCECFDSSLSKMAQGMSACLIQALTAPLTIPRDLSSSLVHSWVTSSNFSATVWLV